MTIQEQHSGTKTIQEQYFMPHHTDKEAKSVFLAFHLCTTKWGRPKHSSQVSVLCKGHSSATSANLCRKKRIILYSNTLGCFIAIQKRDRVFCIGDNW